MEAQVVEVAKPEHCYEIPWDVDTRHEGSNQPMLLNRCTGDSWRWNANEGGWSRVRRD